LNGKKHFLLIIVVALVVTAAWAYLLALRPLLFSAGGNGDGTGHPDPDCAVTAVKNEMTSSARSADYTLRARKNSGEINVTPGADKGIIVEADNYDSRWIVFYHKSSGYTVMCLNESAETLTPGCKYYPVLEKPPVEESERVSELTLEQKLKVWDAAALYESSIKYNDPNRLRKMEETEKVIAERYRLKKVDVAEILAEGRRENWPKPE
jgi:hypothetical protein